MVVRCPSCQTAYRLEALRVPEAGVRVRCPRCTHVFRMRTSDMPPAPAPAAKPAAPAAPSAPRASSEALTGFEFDHREPPRLRPPSGSKPSTRPNLPPRPAWESQERTIEFDDAQPARPKPRLETEPFRPGAAESNAVATAPVRAPEAPTAPSPESGGLAPTHDRARRLARVLVSDILVYNQAVRDRARNEGNLATALGTEITKAWELYKSKVSPEVVASTTYFKDALNEILAGGEKIF